MKRFEVVVVGAGPTGVIAALSLAYRGIDVLLVEMHPQSPRDMRASTFHPPTLDMMEALGLLDALEAQGLRAPVYQYRNRRSGDILAFDLGEVADVLKYPYRLQCEQYKLSHLVTGLLEAHPNAEVLHNHRLVHLEQDSTGVTLSLEGPLAIERVHADYMIAADGANSITRKWLDVPFDGFTWPEKFLTLSTEYPADQHFPGLCYVNYIADADEWCVLLRVPTLWRILVPTSADETDESLRSDAKRDQVFGGLFGDAGRHAATHHRTVYRVHQRVAHTFHCGRVLLAGDAAHLNNPLGGLGMNCGIHDVVNLAEKLALILRDGADADALLGRYSRQRRAIVNDFVQRQTIRNKHMLEAGTAAAQRRTQDEMAGLLTNAVARCSYLLQQSMYTSLQQEQAIT